jgi:hypothetical protein
MSFWDRAEEEMDLIKLRVDANSRGMNTHGNALRLSYCSR